MKHKKKKIRSIRELVPLPRASGPIKDFWGLATRCGAFYDGSPNGPLVGYTKGRVGEEYINFAKICECPHVLQVIAWKLKDKLEDYCVLSKADTVVGIPTGGAKLAYALAHVSERRSIELTKKLTTRSRTPKTKLVLDRHTIRRGEKVILCEDVCNTCGTIKEAIETVTKAGAKVIAIVCYLNRGKIEKAFDNIPVFWVVKKEFKTYGVRTKYAKQEIERRGVIWNPKREWDLLQEVMKRKKNP